MEALNAFGTFVVDLVKSVDNLSPAIKKELYPFSALILTILFVRAHYIMHYRLAWKSQRKSALQAGVEKAEIQQVRFLVVGPVVFGVFLGFMYFYNFSGPHALGLFTNPQVVMEKFNNTQICENAMKTGNLQLAETVVRNKSVGAALHRTYKASHMNMASLLGSLANFCIIYTGAMFSILPFLALMVVHTMLWPIRCFNDNMWGLSTRFFDVVIPVVNIVTAISLLVFFVFHLLVDTWRAENCLWTSGHWYTYVITTLCFFFVLTHLILNEPERLAAPYAVWFGFQQFLSFSALRETQLFFHSMAEALDGVRYALLLFPLLALVGGYIARRQCKPPSVNPIESAKKIIEKPGASEISSAARDNVPASASATASDDKSAEPVDDYVYVAPPEEVNDASISPVAAAPEAPPLSPSALAPPKPAPSKPAVTSKPVVPKPPAGARLDPSELGEQIKQQRNKMKRAAKQAQERPLEGLALQLRNIRAMVNPDAGLEQEANEEDWED